MNSLRQQIARCPRCKRWAGSPRDPDKDIELDGAILWMVRGAPGTAQGHAFLSEAKARAYAASLVRNYGYAELYVGTMQRVDVD